MSIRFDRVIVLAYPTRVLATLAKNLDNFTGTRDFDLTTNLAVRAKAQELLDVIAAEAASKQSLTVETV